MPLENKNKLRDYFLETEREHQAPDFKSFKEITMRKVIHTLFGIYLHKLPKDQQNAFAIAHRMERRTPTLSAITPWLSQVDILFDGEHIGSFYEDRRSGKIFWKVVALTCWRIDGVYLF